MVCILAKGSGDYASPAYHDHPPQRLLQNFPDTTLASKTSSIVSDDPITLDEAAKTTAQMFVWCRTCGHQNQTDPAGLAQQLGDKTSLRAWRVRLVCSQCGSRDVEMVLLGRRRPRH
jgi:hypothetical protein